MEIPRGHLANRLEILKMHLSPLQQTPQDQLSNQLVIHQIHVSNSKVDSAGEVGFDIGQCALFAKVDILVASVMFFGASVAGAGGADLQAVHIFQYTVMILGCSSGST